MPQSEYFRISTAENNYVKVPELFMKMLSILYTAYIKWFFLFLNFLQNRSVPNPASFLCRLFFYLFKKEAQCTSPTTTQAHTCPRAQLSSPSSAGALSRIFAIASCHPLPSPRHSFQNLSNKLLVFPTRTQTRR